MGIFILPVEIGDLSHSSLIQDFCPMLSLFLRPHFNRGFGPVRGDPNDMPSHGASFISLSFHIASMRSDPSLFQPGSLPQSSSRPTRFHLGLDKPRCRAMSRRRSAGRDSGQISGLTCGLR
jgi:hypothetical protein